MKCDFKGCGNEANLRPKLLFFAPEKYGPHPPIEMIIGLNICPGCARAKNASDFLSDEAFEILTQTLKKMNKILPDKSRTQVEFQDIE